MFDDFDVIIVGCGLSGSVIAERYAELNKKVVIIDKRDHIGGNCYDFIDNSTNILCSKYGPHFFHTNDEEVWEYIHRFAEWERYEHKCVGNIDGKLVPIPVNMTTVNMLCNENLQTEEEMDEWLKKNQVKFENITNGEEMSLSLVGKTLYEKIFKNYTYKQWAKYPNELKPEILARIPLRKNFDNRYFTDKYQVLPIKGYTNFFKNLLNNDNIKVVLNTDYFDIKDKISKNKIIIYTGPVDRYFSDLGYEKLEYRSIDFVFEIHENMNYYQPYTQVNYPNHEEFTRITEYKHPYNQKSKHTIITKEYSNSYGEPYYPVLNDKNLELFEKYKKMSIEETKNNIHFVGRLANYKYFNMDQAIKNSLDYFNTYLNKPYNVVVAKYKENIDWINEMDKNKIIIYNKSDELMNNAINRPNIGRDPETFLYHIIEKYDNLPDYLFFLQGNPFDHFTQFNGKLQNEINKISSEKQIGVAPFLTHLHLEHYATYPGLKVREYYSLFFKGDAPEILQFSAGCQYVVSKKNILNRPKKFYTKMYDMIIASHLVEIRLAEQNNIFYTNSINVWTVERLLFYVFSDNIEILDNI